MKKQHPISNRPVPSLLPQEVKHNPDLAPLVRLAWKLRAQGKSYEEIIKSISRKNYARNQANRPAGNNK